MVCHRFLSSSCLSELETAGVVFLAAWILLLMPHQQFQSSVGKVHCTGTTCTNVNKKWCEMMMTWWWRWWWQLCQFVLVSCVFVGCYVSQSMLRWQDTAVLHCILWQPTLASGCLSWLKPCLISDIQRHPCTASIFPLKMCFLSTQK